MKKNMGTLDRILRSGIAVVLILFYAFGIIHGTVGLVLVALSFILILSSLVSVCPMYLPFGLSTIRKKAGH
ncbi:YgaP family membrane protein [Chryseolinea lacunae]|uniref:DUF2892 domain-containing protein n=1 Tax=Chryseolinea lacunae TaxID=2801331 RepID=A0ABS1KNN8_9BACT|nr:DUF2892 domain-containing protein [Chryseolinea lacunae]MBL0740959.1 DUF2892 domain-containing protein [Chryseolinea lacunae]